VQREAIPRVLSGGSVLLASETGSGKTLAYLLPLVARLRAEEAAAGGVREARPGRPRALVLSPTRELAEQIFGVAKQVSHSARLRVALAGGGGSRADTRRNLSRPVDLLVGTPGRVLEHAGRGGDPPRGKAKRNGGGGSALVSLRDLRCVVVDEADTMFDQGFAPDVRRLLAPLFGEGLAGGAGATGQAVLVAATLTKPVRQLLDAEAFPFETVETASLHRPARGARQAFLPVGQQDKLALLAQVLHGRQAQDSTVVFCNTLASCRACEHHLSELGLDTLCLHGDVPPRERREVIARFRAGDAGLLVCTDLAARGLDFGDRPVGHVVMFDFPLNSVDYLHRAGRTARAGAGGRVTSLVARRDAVLAGRIEEALRTGATLESLSSAKEERAPKSAAGRGAGVRDSRGRVRPAGGTRGAARGTRRGGEAEGAPRGRGRPSAGFSIRGAGKRQGKGGPGGGRRGPRRAEAPQAGKR